VRRPVRAGTFYPADGASCASEIDRFLEAEGGPVADPLGGIAPHAGWIFSGPTAGRVFRALRDSGKSFSRFLFFGAVHTAGGFTHALWPEGAWETPLGEVPVDAALNGALVKEAGGLVEVDADAHRSEHSVEVLVPFVRHLFPEAAIAVLSVPPSPKAIEVGEAVGRAASSLPGETALLASSDLTHYGASSYGFAPKGTGEEALAWVREENDARIIDKFTKLDAPGILTEASTRRSACGAGAAAAAVAAARALGARRGVLVEYTTSHDARPTGPPTDFVGYAGVVFEGGGSS
jgi:AmmeMemoRadiSam system protein B